jgi:hypothetical protein
MDIIDRSSIPSLHEAARRQRSAYVSCLFKSVAARITGWFAVDPRRTAPCG